MTTENHDHDHDHEYTDLEILLMQKIRSYQNDLSLIHQARVIMNAALLQLLPFEGNSVIVQLDTPITSGYDNDKNITAISITREGDKLAIGQA